MRQPRACELCVIELRKVDCVLFTILRKTRRTGAGLDERSAEGGRGMVCSCGGGAECRKVEPRNRTRFRRSESSSGSAICWKMEEKEV